MYEVEKGVPIPVIDRKNKSKYPFAKMEIKDSFFVASADVKLFGLRSTMCRYAKLLGGNFTVREVDGGIRVWRKA